jgi:hypothetical protein
MIDNDLFANFVAQHNPQLVSQHHQQQQHHQQHEHQSSNPTPTTTTQSQPSPLQIEIQALQLALCETHIALDDALPLIVAKPRLASLIERSSENANCAASHIAIDEPISLRIVFAIYFALASIVLALLPWRVAAVLLASSLGAMFWWRNGRVYALRRIVDAQVRAREFASGMAALDRATVRALRSLQECELLARGRRVSSTIVSQLDDAANLHRNRVLLAAVASATARVRRALDAAVADWRAQLKLVECASALVTVSDRRVASLQGSATVITDEYIAVLDSLQPTTTPTISLAALKQLHHANCAIRSHLMTLLLVAAEEPRRASAIGSTLERLARQLGPLATRVDNALTNFVVIQSTPPAPSSVVDAPPKPRRSRRRFQSQLAECRDAANARLGNICEQLQRVHIVTEESDDTDVTPDDVNVAYRQFRRVRDDLRDALHEWERAHAPLASILSSDGSVPWRDPIESTIIQQSIESDDDSDDDEDDSLLVAEKLFVHDGAVSNDENEQRAPMTREERMARMAQRQAEREQREAAEAKQRKTMDLMDELSQVLQQRTK